MAEFKLNVSDKTGKTTQKKVAEDRSGAVIGKRIGDKVDGEPLGFAGFEFEITGGSDYCGFPMRKGIEGIRRKKILIGKSVGFKGKLRKLRKGKPYRRRPGIRRKKSVCPSIINETISQINVKVLKSGSEDLFKKEEPAKE